MCFEMSLVDIGFKPKSLQRDSAPWRRAVMHIHFRVMNAAFAEKTKEVGISGTRPELLGLAEYIAGRISTLELCSRGQELKPYSKPLHKISVARARTPIRITVADDQSLQISGESEKLAILSESIAEFAASGNGPEHLHIEYHEGHGFLAHDSLPTVIYLAESVSPEARVK
jgi:hypothetical protein